jgi:hypothetical protein
MVSPKKQSKLIRGLIVFIILVVGIPLFIYVVITIRNHILLQHVITAVQTEFDKIQLPNQVSEDTYVSGSGCSYDYKVGATRCSLIYTKYFVANKEPIDELMRVDKYVTDVGWRYNLGHPYSREEYQRMLAKGFMPFEIYLKERPYPLKMHVSFIGDRDREFSNQKPIELLDKYSNQYPSIYSISISSDIVS